MANTGTIRTITICLIRRNSDLFVLEGRDRIKGEIFYRPLGGGIEFGERGDQAVRREMREEIGAEIDDVRYLGLLENIFTYEGKPMHEIVLVYGADFRDRVWYERGAVTGREDDGTPFPAMWKPLSEFDGGAILYPQGLREMILRLDDAADSGRMRDA